MCRTEPLVLLCRHALSVAGFAVRHVPQGWRIFVGRIEGQDAIEFGERGVKVLRFQQDIGFAVSLVKVCVFDGLVGGAFRLREGQRHAHGLELGVPSLRIVPRIERIFALAVGHGFIKFGDVLCQHNLPRSLQADHGVDVARLFHHSGVVEVGRLGHHACFLHLPCALDKRFGAVAGWQGQHREAHQSGQCDGAE